MGHFKAISHKRRLKRKIKIILILLLFLIVSVITIKKHIKVEEIYLKIIVENALQADMESAKKDIKKKEKEVFKEDKPVVYLYNTHQNENYANKKISSYNIDYSVMFASHILKAYLDNLDITTIVETSSVDDILSEYNYTYTDSYKASRILLEKNYSENPNIDYFIDIHRDSAQYDITTCEINGKKYARIMFVVGLDHDKYQDNLKQANELNQKLYNYNRCLTRGVLEKSGPSVNGIYNQDFSKNVFLIELGGQDNEISEVENTLKVFAEILSNYIKGAV